MTWAKGRGLTHWAIQVPLDKSFWEQLGEDIPYVQRKVHQNNIRPVHRNLASQKGLERHIQGTKWEEHAAKNTLSGEIKIFQDQQGLKEYGTTKQALQEILGGGGSIKEERTQECHRTEIYGDNL